MENTNKPFPHGIAAKVAVEGVRYGFDKLYEYTVPYDMEGIIQIGIRVAVPFGKANKKRVGLIFGIRQLGNDERLKPLYMSIDDEPVISKELLNLCVWMKENTFCTYFDAFKAILPPGLGYTLKTHYSTVSDFDGTLTKKEKVMYSLIRDSENRMFLDDKALKLNAGVDQGRTLNSLIAKGAVKAENFAKRRVGDETVSMVRLKEMDTNLPLTPKQRQVIKFIEESDSASVKEVCYACTVTSAVITRMADKGILEKYEYRVFRTQFDGDASENPSDIVFTESQQKVYEGLLKLMNDPQPKCALLRGVTGSGKTSIYIRLIDEALKQGKSSIMMVPEISLTPQMVGKFRKLFGSEVAIIHSGLSLGERADEYTRIKNGNAHIVIGTRSAVFAPVENLGIIVIDEEGEGTYKSESSPRYHAREAAKQRCFANGAFLLLASATPSLESYFKAKSGKYVLFELNERYKGSELPDVYMVDMKAEMENGNHGTFSLPLIEAIKENLEKGEQSILLLNRRGYHTSMRCSGCGAMAKCPNCELPLTYHKANETLTCHYCGYTRRVYNVCPECGGNFFVMKGTGTQRIEDEISVMFPKAAVLRMDADTTSTRNAYESKFRDFAEGKYDIIVGTQMIAKGLDFPNVTLVGVLKADNSLYAGDFRAYERTFSLITQVVGRSGRGGKHGRAFVQTFTPEHYVLNYAVRQDYEGFYNEEIALRKALIYPPFCDILSVNFSSIADLRCRDAAKRFGEFTDRFHKELAPEIPMVILGPAAGYPEKVNGRYRYRLIIKCRNSKKLRNVIGASLNAAEGDGCFAKVIFYADLNGELL